MLDLTPYAQQNARVTLTLRNGDELTTTLRWDDSDYPVLTPFDSHLANGRRYQFSESPADIIAIRPADSAQAVATKHKVAQVAVSGDGDTIIALRDDGAIFLAFPNCGRIEQWHESLPVPGCSAPNA